MRTIEPLIPVAPPRLITKADALARSEKKLRSSLKTNIARLQELADGLYLVGPTPKGEVGKYLVLRDSDGNEDVLGFGIVVYRVPPSREALTYLIDRALGKPPSRVEVAGDGGGPVQIIPWRPLESADNKLLTDGHSDD